MQYLIDIRINEGRKRTYRIDAKTEEEALERLKLRLPPQQRDVFVVDMIKIDPATVVDEDPYGVFGGE
ncbi:MAG: hypothetical protein PF439_06570 [Helicobacteraceae bacterium]|jgi:hypothetical protein|nr:hypothetical protein [Helicobacteraceae bacterium]